MQEVSFLWELVIADDFSTDGTREILVEYERRYPDFIKLILQERNVGATQNWLELITYPKSKYIAYFEGDDCWIDPNKLQIQFEVLEKKDEFVICTHNAEVYINGTLRDRKYVNAQMKQVNCFKDVLASCSFPSSSIFYRNYLLNENDYEILRLAPVGDWILQLLLLRHGNMFYLNKAYSKYNIHENNFWGSLKRGEQFQSKIAIYQFILNRFKLEKQEIEIVKKGITDANTGLIQDKVDRFNFNVFKEIRNITRYNKARVSLRKIFTSLVPTKIKSRIKGLFLNK